MTERDLKSRSRMDYKTVWNEIAKIDARGAICTGSTDESFELVFSLLVLQHLEREDAYRYLVAARRVLVSTGRLYLQFPNFLSDEYGQAFISEVYARERSPGRVRTYTETEVRRMLALAGFRVIDLRFAGGSKGDAEMYFVADKK